MLDPSYEDVVCATPAPQQLLRSPTSVALRVDVPSEYSYDPSWQEVLASPSVDMKVVPVPTQELFRHDVALPSVTPRETVSNLLDLRYAATLQLPQTKACRPKPGNSIEPSSFRPNVPAIHRPFMWTTPHSIKMQESLDAELPSHLQARIYQKLAVSLVPGTLSSYSAGPVRFTQFCDKHHIPESMCMPASSTLLAAFVASASAAGLGSGSMIKNWMNGLAFWHAVNAAEWHGKDDWVPLVLRAAVREGVTFKRPPRGPVTVEHLRALRKTLSLQEPRDAAIWAVATSAFWGCRRLGEMLPGSAKKFDLKYHVSRGTAISRSTVAGHRTIVFQIPWTKTTTVAGGSVFLTATTDDLCPVMALENHLRVNHSADASTPLFAYRESRRWSILTKMDFLDLTTRVYQDALLEHVFGHSYCIGGSLRLLLDGVEPEVIMKIGGWSSLCFLIYWRRLELIIPLALSRAWATKITDFAARNNLSEDTEGLEL